MTDNKTRAPLPGEAQDMYGAFCIYMQAAGGNLQKATAQYRDHLKGFFEAGTDVEPIVTATVDRYQRDGAPETL